MKEYKFLKIARNIFRVLAWVVLVFFVAIGIIQLVVGGVVAPTIPGAEAGQMPRLFGLVFMIMGAFYFLILYAISEIIGLLLDLKTSCTKPAV